MSAAQQPPSQSVGIKNDDGSSLLITTLESDLEAAKREAHFQQMKKISEDQALAREAAAEQKKLNEVKRKADQKQKIRTTVIERYQLEGKCTYDNEKKEHGLCGMNVRTGVKKYEYCLRCSEKERKRHDREDEIDEAAAFDEEWIVKGKEDYEKECRRLLSERRNKFRQDKAREKALSARRTPADRMESE